MPDRSRWDKDAVLGLIVQAAQAHDGSRLSHNRFQRWATETGTTVPSILTIIDRFGSWNHAVVAAGLETNEPFSPSTGQAGIDECRRALVEFKQQAAQQGLAPTASTYRRMSRHYGWPSFGTLRYRLGVPWSEMTKTSGGVSPHNQPARRVA